MLAYNWYQMMCRECHLWKQRQNSFSSDMFSSRWTFEVRWTENPQALQEKFHLCGMARGHQATDLVLRGALLCSSGGK